MIQDSKHGLKTFRNNLFSGAHLLVLGNYIAIYLFARDLAFQPDSPLFNRDVEKVDRQDDNAATRLFSATALNYLIKRHPEHAGQIVYLFVFGELVDAYQNRFISHRECIKMVLYARFFLETWRAYLKAAGYPEVRYLISREAVDITRILIDGLITLVIVHRDHMDGKIFPLLPWLHSSKVCEHVFGECRKIVKDFTYLDFLYMIPRLHILLQSVIKLLPSSNAKDRASGYAHSYYDTDDIDLAQLAVFPTDTEICDAAQDAWDEQESLWSLLGIRPADFLTPSPQNQTPFPSISSWFAPGQDPVPADVQVPFEHNPFDLADPASDSEDEVDDISEVVEADYLQHLVDNEETTRLRSTKDDDRMLDLTCAAVAIALDEQVVM
ncbi:hypothetical protein A0H81_10762 [Grifola frondosa]|uniref:Uncharacterized protein n=1 Tax=Grifola frondosa TaxID=5627 RepID=A0A1C7LWI5_GRIFR|nr:hypothetical protein A0H81_10762 [Grifola frondosa]